MSNRLTNWMPVILVIASGPAALGQAVTYRGLIHSPLGSAVLDVLPDDTLRVAGIDSVGMPDGVSISLTGAQFARGAFAGLDPAGLSGATWQADTYSSSSMIASTQLVDAGSEWELVHSFPFLGAAVETVEAYRNGEVVASGTFTGGPVALLQASSWHVTYASWDSGTLRSVIDFDPNAIVTIFGAPSSVNADRLMISTPLSAPLPTLVHTDVTASNMSSFRVTDAELGMLGFRHRARGQATLTASGVCPSCTLTVGNIGSSGEDGVEVDLVGSAGISTRWLPFSTPLPNGASLVSSAIGTVGGVPDTLFAELSFEDQGANLVVSADFSGIGATTRIVEVYFRGSLVQRLTGQSGATVATLADTDWPIGTAAQTRVGADQLPGLRATWSDGVSITLSGGPTVVGTELVVMGEHPSQFPMDLTVKRDGIGDLPGLDISDQNCIPECPSDVDGDNNVDITDLGIVLAHYGQNGATHAEGDLNGDSMVNITDLGLLLSGFGTTCNGCQGQY